MNYRRFYATVLAAVLGWGLAILIWADPNASRFGLAISGLLAAVGVAAAFVLLVFLWVVIADDVKPRLRLGRPAVPMSLTHREASLIGQKAFRHHPITYWGALTFSNRFVFGFLVLAKPTHERFRDTDGSPQGPDRNGLDGEAATAGAEGIAR